MLATNCWIEGWNDFATSFLAKMRERWAEREGVRTSQKEKERVSDGEREKKKKERECVWER